MKYIILRITVLVIILVLLCLQINTKSFIYPFLSYAYYLHLFLIIISVFVLTGLIFKQNEALHIPISLLAWSLWGLYIFLYWIFALNVESYYITYLLTMLYIGSALYACLKLQLVRSSYLLISLAFMAVIVATVSLLQTIGISHSTTPYFKASGLTDNPNIAAMYIALSIPACIKCTGYWSVKYKFLIIPSWMLIATALVVLQCRSALIGAGIGLTVYAVAGCKLRFSTLRLGYKIFAILASVVAIIVVFFIHQHKQASADGRMTIWHISGKMVADKPFFGHGYGLFEREYNLYQAIYFNQTLRPEHERMNAGFTAMAYNEYIEQTVMGGLVGGMLFVGVLLVLIVSGWRNRTQVLFALAGMSVFAGISFMNFTIQSPVLFFTAMVYATIIIAEDKSTLFIRSKIFISKKVQLVFIFSGLFFGIVGLQKYNAQKKLKIAINCMTKGDILQAKQLIEDIEPDISTSEAFYRTKSELLFETSRPTEAVQALKQASLFSSNPAILLRTGLLSEKAGDYASAERYFRLASGVEPHKFLPRVLLMHLYAQTRNRKKKENTAHEILALTPKIPSNDVTAYKREAGMILNGQPVNQ